MPKKVLEKRCNKAIEEEEDLSQNARQVQRFMKEKDQNVEDMNIPGCRPSNY